jgi:hypothetical protein
MPPAGRNAAYLAYLGVLNGITGTWMRFSRDGDERPPHFARPVSSPRRSSDVGVVGTTLTSLNLASPPKKPDRGATPVAWVLSVASGCTVAHKVSGIGAGRRLTSEAAEATHRARS